MYDIESAAYSPRVLCVRRQYVLNKIGIFRDLVYNSLKIFFLLLEHGAWKFMYNINYCQSLTMITKQVTKLNMQLFVTLLRLKLLCKKKFLANT